jgi:hypothetical protein
VNGPESIWDSSLGFVLGIRPGCNYGKANWVLKYTQTALLNTWIWNYDTTHPLTTFLSERENAFISSISLLVYQLLPKKPPPVSLSLYLRKGYVTSHVIREIPDV